jgi:hypothetical protein
VSAETFVDKGTTDQNVVHGGSTLLLVYCRWSSKALIKSCFTSQWEWQGNILRWQANALKVRASIKCCKVSHPRCTSAGLTRGWLPGADDGKVPYKVPVTNVTGEILDKIVEYFRKRDQIEGESDEKEGNDIEANLKAWDSKFMAGVDQAMLFGLIKVRQSCIVRKAALLSFLYRMPRVLFPAVEPAKLSRT